MADGDLLGIAGGALAAGITQTFAVATATCASYAFGNDSVVSFEAIVLGVNAGTPAQTFRTTIHGTVTVHGGVATIRGANDPVSVDDNTGGATAIVDANGADLRVRVTGVAAKTINWSAAIYPMHMEQA